MPLPPSDRDKAREIYDAYKDQQVPQVLLKQTNWEELNFYRKSDVVYQLTRAASTW